MAYSKFGILHSSVQGYGRSVWTEKPPRWFLSEKKKSKLQKKKKKRCSIVLLM